MSKLETPLLIFPWKHNWTAKYNTIIEFKLRRDYKITVITKPISKDPDNPNLTVSKDPNRQQSNEAEAN